MLIDKITRLEHACNTRLTVVRGQAWITIDGDPRDIVLEAGREFVVDSDQPVLIYALNANRPLELEIDASAPRCAPAPRHGLAGWLQSLRGLIATPALQRSAM